MPLEEFDVDFKHIVGEIEILLTELNDEITMIPSIVPKEICDIEFPDTIEMEVPNDNKLFAIMDTALSLMLPEVKPKDVIPE